jgi:predicted O-methyltransferase YrrM
MNARVEPLFSQDWFSRSIPSWAAILGKLSSQSPALKILEVGVFEGRSTCWLLENFCKSADCRIIAVDSFQGGEEHQKMNLGGLRARFEANIAAVESACSVEVREGDSLVELCRLVTEGSIRQFDFISIDASHRACDVIGDAVLAFRLLRRGGVLAFDDYLWSPFLRGSEDPLSTPKIAIDAFTTIFARQARVLSGLPLYQVYLQKY